MDDLDGAAYEDLLAAAMFGHSTAEAEKLVSDFAHELIERARRGVGVLEEHVGGFQHAREVREVLDVVDPKTATPDGWEF